MAGKIYWITGLSGAGKSENAVRLERHLRDHGRPCVRLDGDEIRQILNSNHQNTYTRSTRIELGHQYLHLCKLLSSQDIDVVLAAMGLYRELHEWRAANLPNCITIYLDVPISELRRRDPKQIYVRYFAKQLTNVAGLDLAIDPPEADIHIKWQEGMDTDRVWDIIKKEIKSLP